MSHGPLCQSDLLAAGPLQRLGTSWHAFRELGSTNAFLLNNSAELPDGAVAWTEFQSAGRGRLGRRWEAPRGASILLSVLLHEPPGSTLAGDVTLAAALAACAAVAASTSCQPQVRWPNDVYVGERKLGGVLAETRPGSGGGRAVVVGIGLNCLQQAGHFPPDLRDRATSLELECPEPVDRARVAAALLADLDRRFAAPDPDDWQRAWRAASTDYGTRIELTEAGVRYAGTVVDLVEGGQLVLQLETAGRRVFSPQTASRTR